MIRVLSVLACIILIYTFRGREEKNNSQTTNSNSLAVNASTAGEDSLPSEKAADEASNAAYHRITADEAQSMMISEEQYILLDVRTEDEYKEKRIDGSILIPDFEITERAESELPDNNQLILVYCRSGRRSEIAANELVKRGYTNVYDFGGILDWPYDTVSD